MPKAKADTIRINVYIPVTHRAAYKYLIERGITPNQILSEGIERLLYAHDLVIRVTPAAYDIVTPDELANV